MTSRRLVEATEFSRFVGCHTAGSVQDSLGAELIIARDSVATARFVDNDPKSRSVSYLLSDESIARDGHRVMTAGFQLNSFRLNPVFLWAHDCSQPPIGRISSIAVQSNRLLGTIEYADPDLSQFADMIFRMVKRGFLNAVSISWKPIEWKYAKEKDRNGGIDFVKQDLLEVSQVPVPALATALATARSAGIDVTPMKTWAERVLDERNSTLLQKLDPEHIRAIACGQQTDNYVNRERRIREAEAIALSCPD